MSVAQVILLCGRSDLLHRGVGRFQLSTSRPLFALPLLYCMIWQIASSFFCGPALAGPFFCFLASFLVPLPYPHLFYDCRRQWYASTSFRGTEEEIGKRGYLLGNGPLFLLFYKLSSGNTSVSPPASQCAPTLSAGCRSSASVI